jgi:hypothetical protein
VGRQETGGFGKDSAPAAAQGFDIIRNTNYRGGKNNGTT